MSILIVDDSPTIRMIINKYLNAAGYSDLLFAESASDAFQILGISPGSREPLRVEPEVDLILLDIVLPDMDGREACRIIKSVEKLQDIPVITVTSLMEKEHLEKAFEAGAMDYITKPVNNIELQARVRSALKLKQEMDGRKAREKKLIEVTRELGEAVRKLDQLSSLDGLTEVANRRRFDEYINSEWLRGRRNAKPLSLLMIDIDFFKAYNDTYGHRSGDKCLKAVAGALQNTIKRPGDLLCRYGGEEFAAILPDTPDAGALLVARSMCTRVETMRITHEKSSVSKYVTISLGVSTIIPTRDLSPADLISLGDRALYCAKRSGRNCVRVADIDCIDDNGGDGLVSCG